MFGYTDVRRFGEETEGRRQELEALVRQGASSVGAVSRPPMLRVAVG
ncbi:hypothetical protein [uncultured Imperialibacter sp.]